MVACERAVAWEGVGPQNGFRERTRVAIAMMLSRCAAICEISRVLILCVVSRRLAAAARVAGSHQDDEVRGFGTCNCYWCHVLSDRWCPALCRQRRRGFAGGPRQGQRRSTCGRIRRRRIANIRWPGKPAGYGVDVEAEPCDCRPGQRAEVDTFGCFLLRWPPQQAETG